MRDKCAFVKSETQAWWIVDLGADYFIQNVIIKKEFITSGKIRNSDWDRSIQYPIFMFKQNTIDL